MKRFVMPILGIVSLIILLHSEGNAVDSKNIEPPKVSIVYSQFSGKGLFGRYDLFLLSPDSLDKAKQLTSSETFGPVCWYPKFSPDGRQILFIANKPGSTTDIDLLESPTYNMLGTDLWVLATDSNTLRALDTDGSGYKLFSWSPDGMFVAAIQYGWPPYDHIMIWDSKSGKQELLSKRLKQDEENITDLFWRSDSKGLYFQRSTTPSDYNLYFIANSNKKIRTQINSRNKRKNYSFSYDGKNVAFSQDGSAFIAHVDGSNAKKAAKILGRLHQSRPAWSKDNQLAISDTIENKGKRTKIYVYDLVSSKFREISEIPYNITEIRWSKNNEWLFTKIMQTGNTDLPDPKTDWYTYRREGLLAISVETGRMVTLKKPDEETKGLDWYEL